MKQQGHFTEQDRIARAKRGFYIHLLVFVVVNLILAIVTRNNPDAGVYLIWTLLGWGLGLLSHALAVFLSPKPPVE